MKELKTPEQKLEQQKQVYAESNNSEAHIIADMLPIESITTELRESKKIQSTD